MYRMPLAATTAPPPQAPSTMHWLIYNTHWPLYAAIAAGAGAGALLGGHDHRVLGAVLGGVAVPVGVVFLISGLWTTH